MNAFLKEVLDTPLSYGEGRLWWLGQMGLLVKLGKTLLCIDYYATESPKRQVPPPIPAGELEGVDLILGTHNHSDHMDHPSWKIWAKTCPGAGFVFPRMHEADVEADGIAKERRIGMDDGEKVGVCDVTIHALAAAHEFLVVNPAPCLSYVIEGNGLRIYHAGDTLRYEGMRPRLASYGHLDAALLPINGRDAKRYARNCIGNMTYQEAADLAGELKPGLVLPGHYDLFADNGEDPEAFASYLEVKYAGAVKCQIPKILEPIVLRA